MKIKIEADKREANLMLNAEVMLDALEEVKNYMRRISRGEDKSFRYMLNGHCVSQRDLMSINLDKEDDLMSFIDIDDFINTLEDILYPVKNLYDEYYD